MNAFYTVIADPYCYPGTTVLKNKAGLRSQVELDAFESRMTALRAEEPLPLGRLSVRHYQAIHRHLFQDVYPWAGKLRTVRISKNQSMFCYPENIPSQLSMLFDRLSDRRAFRQQSIDQFSKSLGSFLSNLNAIHPFREGNGRAQLAFAALVAHRAGHPFHFDRLQPQAFLQAMVESFERNDATLIESIRRMCE